MCGGHPYQDDSEFIALPSTLTGWKLPILVAVVTGAAAAEFVTIIPDKMSPALMCIVILALIYYWRCSVECLSLSLWSATVTRDYLIPSEPAVSPLRIVGFSATVKISCKKTLLLVLTPRIRPWPS